MSKSRIKEDSLAPEWSVYVETDKISAAPLTLNITPSTQEREALAKRLGTESLIDLKAEVTLQQMVGSHLINVTGTFTATVTQNCVVTLQPIEIHIRDEFETWFSDKAQAIPYARARQDVQRKASNQQEIELLDEKDDPETVINGKIDIGELVVQYLCLSIDPYPHAPDIDADRPEVITAGIDISPFADLAKLTAKKE